MGWSFGFSKGERQKTQGKRQKVKGRWMLLSKLGHPFSLVSGARAAPRTFCNLGARRAEKNLLLQPWRARRGAKFGNARLGHPFSLVSGARSAEKILLLQPWRAQREENLDNAILRHLLLAKSICRYCLFAKTRPEKQVFVLMQNCSFPY